MPYADLHTHTIASDGTQPPEDNVKMAKAAGLAGIAITDHDSVGAVEGALRAGAAEQIEVVPGVEISTVAGGQDIHVLGYYIDHQDARLQERLRELRNTRTIRNEMLVERLRALGIDITLDEVIEGTSTKEGAAPPSSKTIGRPHIADALVKKGIVQTIGEAFEKYLGKEGAAYVNPPRISPFTAIDWIKDAGGAAVLAHPGLYRDDELVLELIWYGVDGIEVYHPDHDGEDEQRYLRLVHEHGLIATAGSDFHGYRGGNVFHAPVGACKIDIRVLAELEKCRRREKKN